MIGTAAGGYLLLMAVVIGYYYGVARVGADFLYGPGYEYGPPPDLPFPPYARRGRRIRTRDLEDYLEDLEDELARVRRELQELREPGAEARQA